MLKLFIDPGHGGIDPGAVGNGLREKDLTLKISKKIKDLLLEYENVQVKLSRETDQTLSLKQRTDMANSWGADYLLSVHINAGGGTGFESFVHTNSSAASIAHQNVIHPEIMKLLDFEDRDKKRKNLHMVRESKMPALLTESGFIDNTVDAAKLKKTPYIENIALGHANGIVKAFGLKAKGPEKLMWGKTEFKKGQIGRVTILKPINLWTEDVNGKLKMVRILQPGEQFRVYRYREKHEGQYNVGDGHWVTKMDGYIIYETPSKALLEKADELFK